MGTVQSSDGTRIAFDRSGEGPAVILVDGALCSRGFGPMGPIAALLAPRFTVFTYDRRGRGESGDTAPYAVEREVEDINALIQEAGGTAYVFGISSGAALTLEAASRLSGITMLALYEPPYMVDESRQRPSSDYVAHLSELIAANRRGDALAYFMTEAVGLPAESVTPMRQMPMWPALETIAPTLVYDGSIMEHNHWLPAKGAAGITVPTLVMDGGASPEWARNAVRSVVDAIPGAERQTLEGQTHEVAAEVIAPVLAEFFSGGEGA